MHNQAHRDLISAVRAVAFRCRASAARFEHVAIAAGIIAGMIGLTWFAAGVASRGPDDDIIQEPPNGNLIASSQVVVIYSPKTFLEIADDQSLSAAFASHEALQPFLQARNLEKAWYAISSRARQYNGKELMLTVHCRPFEVPTKMAEFRAVLDTLAGRPPSHEFADFSTAKVRIIPERMANSEPGAVIGEALELAEQLEAVR
jgi:hypothetical protein